MVAITGCLCQSHRDKMSRPQRPIGKDLERTWAEATRAPDPINALRASRALHHQLSDWQAVLVAEALIAGLTWEEMGEALGTTRQAAWARFKRVAESAAEGGRMIADELARVRSEANHELEGLYQQLRAQDLEWRTGSARSARDHTAEEGDPPQSPASAEQRTALFRMRRPAAALAGGPESASMVSATPCHAL
jgi:hypothetical protein